MIYECTIIGFGKVGKTLSLLMNREKTRCLLRRIAHHTPPPSGLSYEAISRFCADEILDGKTTEELNIDELRTIRGIVALTVPDKVIGRVAEKLAVQCEVVTGTVVFHCSGVYTSDLLEPLRAKGAFTASIHPAFSFGAPLSSANSFANTVCSYEGDDEALNILLPIFENFGGNLVPIDSQLKATYHAGCCVASNYLVGLYALSENILVSAGIPQNTIPSILIPLMQSTINNLSQCPPAEALSGPIARNDTSTVELHIRNLSEKYAYYYKNLGNLLIDQSGLPHREEIKKILAKIPTSE